MNKSILLLILTFISYNSSAQEFCHRSKEQLKESLAASSSRISFENDGGLFDGGVCWWHNRMQRSSAYLVKFDPKRDPPSRPELYKIIFSLRVMNEVVTIPGYSDFESFTKAYKGQLQWALNDWQKRDGFFNFEWIRGISGKSSLGMYEMQKRMDDVYRHYQNSPAALWVMAQIRGVTSHSLLIMQMNKTDHGYEMEVIDSNHPLETLKIDYQFGDRSLKNDKYTFVPYVGFQNDFRLIATALRKTCDGKSIDLELGKMSSGEIELKQK